MYEIRHAGAKGLGVFAQKLIPRGTRIFSERPLIALHQDQDAQKIIRAARLLSPQDRVELLKLSSASSHNLSILRTIHSAWYYMLDLAEAEGDQKRHGSQSYMPSNFDAFFAGVFEASRIVNIFRNNAFDFGPKFKIRQAVFAKIARLNHSCVPNAQGNFDHPRGMFDIHAMRAVPAGEEITISYLPEQGSPRALRQEKLEAGYNFECACPACDMSTKAGADGEARRVKVHDAIADYGQLASATGTTDLNVEVKITMALIDVLEKDGISGRELVTMYFEAARLNKELGNNEEAISCSTKGMVINHGLFGQKYTPDHEN